MELYETEKYCIVTPLSPRLGERESRRLAQTLVEINKRIGLDLSFVHDCTIDFIFQIIGLKNVSLFNIPSDIFALFTSMNLDKKLSLYVSKLDFLEDKHQLLNRKFSLICNN